MNHLKIPSEIKEYLSVSSCSLSGLIWTKRPYRSRIKIGDHAGTLGVDGYWQVQFKSKIYLAHRVVYFLKFNKDPGEKFIDHITSRDNNTNIRICTKEQNKANVDKQKTYAGKQTSSKFKGVYFCKKTKNWKAYITTNKIKKHLGFFECEKEAAQAYNSAAIKFFGEFAWLNKIT